MALWKQPTGAVVTLVILISTGTQVQNSDCQAVTSEHTSGTQSSISAHRDLSNSPVGGSTVPSRLQNNASVPDSPVDDSATTQPNTDEANSVTQNPAVHQDFTKDTTQMKPKGTTQKPNPNTETTPTLIENISPNITHSVAQNGTKSQFVRPTDSKSLENNTYDNEGETTTGSDISTEFLPVTFDTTWMNAFINTHHFEGQYMFNRARYVFDFVVRYKHPNDPKTLVTNFYDADGAVLEFNVTSPDGHLFVLSLSKIYTPGVRFPLKEPLEVTGTFPDDDQPYFTGNFTKPFNSSFSWFHMNKGLGAIETGETAGTRTAIVIIIPTSIAFLGICGTIAILCWASKKGYLRGRHKSYRLFTNAQVSYESEAETIHI